MFDPADVAAAKAALLRCLPQAGCTEHLELECRLGVLLPSGRFEASVSQAVFDRMLAGLRTNTQWEAVQEIRTVDHLLPDGSRLTVDQATGAASAVAKRKLVRADVRGKGLDARLALAEEAPVRCGAAPPPGTYHRMKHRHRFVHKLFFYDLTAVQQGPACQADDDRAVVYEVELELRHPERHLARRDEKYLGWLVDYALCLGRDLARLGGTMQS